MQQLTIWYYFHGAVYFNMQNITSMYALNDPRKRLSIIPGDGLGAVSYMTSLAPKN